MPPSYREQFERIRHLVTEVQPEEVRAVLEQPDQPRIIDVREQSEWDGGRIPGAELRFFEGGHLFLMQDIEAYAAAINFLEAAK